MKIGSLIRQDWLSFVRSPAFRQEILKTVLLAFLALYFAVNFLALGFFLDKILAELMPGKDPLLIVGKGLIYYFMIDFVVRLFLQKYPGVAIRPYLARPIRKSTLAHYLLVRSLGSFFNFLPLLAVLPFFFKVVTNTKPALTSISFLLILGGFVLASNFGSFLVDRLFRIKSWIGILVAGVIIALLYFDFSGRIGLGIYVEKLFMFLLSNPVIALAPLAAATLLYMRLYRLLISHTYLEDLGINTPTASSSQLSFGFSRWFGQAGRLMDLETRLIWRSKRSKTFLLLSTIMLLYPLIFLDNPAMEWAGMKIFIGLFVTGMFALNYGQLLLSWNSPHFDLLLTRNIGIEDIFRAKYYLLVGTCTILMVFFTVYFFVDRSLFFIGAVMFLYNIGCSIYLYMILASYNSKRIDPMKGAMMNYEGIGVAHFLIMIPLFLIPYGIYKIFEVFGYPVAGFGMIALTGLLGLVFHKQIIRAISKLFLKNRYKIAAAFRKETS